MNELPTALRGAVYVAALALVILTTCLAGSASAALVGLERVAATSTINSSKKGVTASCPAGKRLVGAGAVLTPATGNLLIDDIRPNSALTNVTVNAREDETGTTANWHVQAFAVCSYAPPGLTRVAATSALNSSNKAITASCPAGKRVLGAGGDINTSNGQVLYDDLRPNNNLTNVTLNAREDETGNATNWSLTAYAICANPVAGLQRVSAQSSLNPDQPKLASVSCPDGKQVVGGGGEINSSNGQVVLDAVSPDPALASYRIAAWEDETGNPANWSLTAYAICVNAAQRVVATSATSSVEKLAEAFCPFGKLPTGAGGEITGGLGQVLLDAVVPELSQPGAAVRAEEDEDGTAAAWFLRAYAICATPLPGHSLFSTESPTDNSGPKSVSVSCPAGTRVIGAGGEVEGASDEVAIQITPNPALTSVTASGFEDENGTTADWQVRAYALCANAPPGLQRVSATSGLHSEGEVELVRASCPAGKNLLGTGAEIPGGAGQVVFDEIIPNASLTSVLATAVEDQNGFAGDWRVTAYAICANP